MVEKSVKNCVEVIDGELKECKDFNKCWEKGRLNTTNLCGYSAPRPATKVEGRPKRMRDDQR